jgi:cell division protein FtsZ
MEEGGVLGARGVLINITASSELGIHDVNEACNLIRAATKNDDVQINFGVVMDERMGNDVKVTVIATGFQRDSLPEIDRRGSHFPFSPTIGAEVSTMPPRPPALPEPVYAPEPEPFLPAEAAQVEPEESQQDLLADDDYEMPALTRKQRRAAGA